MTELELENKIKICNEKIDNLLKSCEGLDKKGKHYDDKEIDYSEQIGDLMNEKANLEALLLKNKDLFQEGYSVCSKCKQEVLMIVGNGLDYVSVEAISQEEDEDNALLVDTHELDLNDPLKCPNCSESGLEKDKMKPFIDWTKKYRKEKNND